MKWGKRNWKTGKKKTKEGKQANQENDGVKTKINVEKRLK